MKAKVLKVNCFRDNRSIGFVSMLNALSSRKWGIGTGIFWDVDIIIKSLNTGKGFGINTFKQSLHSRFWYNVLFLLTFKAEKEPNIDIEGVSDSKRSH